MSKLMVYDDEARNKLISGVNKLARTVAVTMGPKGKNVMIGKPVGAPVITKDGVSVAREVVLDDPIENLACQLVKEVAGRTAVIAGDGTTTATVLTDEIITKSKEILDNGFNPIDFRDGIEWAKQQVLSIVEENAIKNPSDQDIINIATISTNNDVELGESIGQAYIWAGADGTVGAEAYPGIKTKVTKLDGITLKTGFSTPNFLQSQGDTEIVMEKCKILIIDRKLSHINDCLDLLNNVHKANSPLLIVSKGVEKDALKALVENNKRGVLNVCCVNFPKEFTSGDWIEDLGILTSSRIASESLGSPLSSFTLNDLGYAERVVISRFTTQLFSSKIDEKRREDKKAAYAADCEQPIGDDARLELKKRIAFLTSKASMISVGYNTELELREKGDRVEDAMHATYAAMNYGIVIGGGCALLRASRQFAEMDIPTKWKKPAQVLIHACTRPITQITYNAGLDTSEIISNILEVDNSNYGYNIITGEVCNMFEQGVVDPLKVTKTALENAVSVAMLIINTDAVMAERPNDPSEWQPPAGWRPPEGVLNHKY